MWLKVQEELVEFQETIVEEQSAARQEDEFGDVLFALVNYARFNNIDPETALERTNRKFISRFKYIEQQATKPLADMTLAEMDTLWNEAKSKEIK